MAKVYYNRIKSGQITIDDVPLRFKNQVQEMLDKEAKRLESLI